MPLLTIFEPAPPPTNTRTIPVRVVPRDADGKLLMGAIVNHEYVIDSVEGAEMPFEFSGDTVLNREIVIRHFGKEVYRGGLPTDLTSLDGGLLYEAVIEDVESNYPESKIPDIGGHWFGHQFMIWSSIPQLSATPERVEFSVASDMQEMFRFDSDKADEEGTQFQRNVHGEIVAATTVGSEAGSRGDRTAIFAREAFMESEFHYGMKVGSEVILRRAGGGPGASGGNPVAVTSVDGPSSIELAPGERRLITFEADPAGAALVPGDLDNGGVVASGGPGTFLIEADSSVETATNVTFPIWDATVSTDTTPPAAEVSITIDPAFLAPTAGLENVETHFPGMQSDAYVTWKTDAPGVVTAVNGRREYFEQDHLFVRNLQNRTGIDIQPILADGRLVAKPNPDEPTAVLIPSAGTRTPALLPTQPLPTLRMVGGTTETIDLTDHFENEVLWSEITWQTRQAPIKGAVIADVTVTLAGSTMTVDTSADFDGRTAIFITAAHEEADPVHFGFGVEAASSNYETDAINASGGVLAWSKTEAFDPSDFAGTNASVLPSNVFETQPGVRRAGLTVGGEPSSITAEVLNDYGFVATVITGQHGITVVSFIDLPEPYYETPVLPSSEIDQIESSGEWVDYSPDLLSPYIQPRDTRRVLTANGVLFSVRPSRAPEQLYFAPPVFFGERWVDQHLYPGDATLQKTSSGQGYVEYRNGLETSKVGPTNVTITSLFLDSTAYEVMVQWTVEVGDHPVRGPIEVELTDTTIPTVEGTAVGTGSVTFRSLRSGTEYEVDVLGQKESIRTQYPIPAVDVTAWRKEEDTFVYKYDISTTAEVEVFDGSVHNSPNSPFEIESDKRVAEQEIRLVWNKGTPNEQSHIKRVPTRWLAPKTPQTGEVDVKVGKEIPGTERPSFYEVKRAGQSSIDFGTNVYPSGRLRFEPYGYLPALLEGAIEDYVDITVYGPDGEEHPPELVLDVPTELRVEAAISSKDGMSPHVAIRVVRSQSPNA